MMTGSRLNRSVLFVLLSFPLFIYYYCQRLSSQSVNGMHSVQDMSKYHYLNSTGSTSNRYSGQLSSSSGCLNRNLAKDNVTLPNVLLIGVQKSGTSSLASWMRRVGICMSEVQPGEPSHYEKEAHYFDYFNTTGKKRKYDFDHSKIYARRFAHCCTGQSKTKSEILAMDATPATVLFPKSVRITFDSVDPTGELAKRAKFMIILREPISRELSFYNHYAYECRKKVQSAHMDTSGHNDTKSIKCSAKLWDSKMRRVKTFSEFMEDNTLINSRFAPEPDPLGRSSWRNMNRGLYADFLREWFELFDREQILVLSQEELVSDEGSFLNRVHSFLGLDSSIGNFHLKQVNAKDDGNKVKEVLCSDQEKLDQIFDPLNEDLYRLLEENSGPPMEQRPFQKFVKRNCTVEDG